MACIVYLWSLGVLKAGSDGFRGGSNGVGGERKKKRGEENDSTMLVPLMVYY